MTEPTGKPISQHFTLDRIITGLTARDNIIGYRYDYEGEDES